MYAYIEAMSDEKLEIETVLVDEYGYQWTVAAITSDKGKRVYMLVSRDGVVSLVPSVEASAMRIYRTDKSRHG